MYPQLSDAEVDQVISEISEFFANQSGGIARLLNADE